MLLKSDKINVKLDKLYPSAKRFTLWLTSSSDESLSSDDSDSNSDSSELLTGLLTVFLFDPILAVGADYFLGLGSCNMLKRLVEGWRIK